MQIGANYSVLAYPIGFANEITHIKLAIGIAGFWSLRIHDLDLWVAHDFVWMHDDAQLVPWFDRNSIHFEASAGSGLRRYKSWKSRSRPDVVDCVPGDSCC